MKSEDRMKFQTTREYPRADGFLKHLGFSNTLLKRSFRKRLVYRGDDPILRTTPLLKGEWITVVFEEEENGLTPSPFQQQILYEDEDLLVIDKGIIPSMPCKMYPNKTLANEIAGYFEKIALARKVRMLGRLDKETTGVLVICKNPYAYIKLVDGHTESKTYLALVHGRVEGAGVIDAAMGPGEKSLVRIIREDGQRAITHYKPLVTGDNSLLELRLETGRCHQIRCHMAAIDHPIVGDELYGGGEGEVHLHVHSIKLVHPRLLKEMIFTAPVPKWAR